jgi:mannosyltransferase
MARRLWIALVLILALAAGLRFATLDLQSYWFDEGFTVSIVGDGLFHLFDGVTETEFTPPLYYLVGWAWAQVFGTGEIGLRSLSALLGTATVGVVYLAGSRLVDTRTGLAAALLFAVNPLAVWYSQEARSYALVGFLSALSLLFLADEYRGRGGSRAIVGWAISAGLALCTHYFAVFMVVPQAAWLLVRRRDGPALIAVGLVGMVGLALLPLAIDQHGHALLGLLGGPLSSRIDEPFFALPGGFYAEWGGRHPWEMYLFGIGLLLLVVTARALDPVRRRGAALALGLALAVIGLALGAAVLGFDYVVYRYFIVALPALTIALGAGLVNRRAIWLGSVVLGAIVIVSLTAVDRFNDDEALHRTDWRSAADAIGEQDPHRALVLTWDGDPTLEAYRATSDVPSGGAEVDEVVYILGGGEHPAPPPTFVPIEAKPVAGFAVTRYRSPHLQRLTAEQLLSSAAFAVYTGHAVLDRPSS